MTVLVLQHIACEPPGVFEDVLVERGRDIHRIELDEGERLPSSISGYSGLVVMGGPMGAYEHVTFPWLVDELSFIAAAVNADVPTLGVCLGAQLLAQATGGRAYRGTAPEVGVLPIDFTDEAATDPLFAGLDTTIECLQWHGDTFDLPPGAVHLGRSPAYENQAFRVRQAWGLQFHIEVTRPMASEWAEVPAYAAALDAVRGPGSLTGLLAEFDNSYAAMTTSARHVGGRFADAL